MAHPPQSAPNGGSAYRRLDTEPPLILSTRGVPHRAATAGERAECEQDDGIRGSGSA